jgi:simple sugar transport system ATP-binding protein
MRKAGVSHVPEDRQKRGLILPFSVRENLVLGRHGEPPFAARGWLHFGPMRAASAELVDNYSIKVGASINALERSAATTFRRNQQKLVVARELATQPVVLVAAQPTRGLDVGATEYIHKILISMRDAGVAILLVSAELDEIMSLSDRIAVMFNGRIVSVKRADETCQVLIHQPPACNVKRIAYSL